jgi:hypothetical protein
VNNGDAMMPTLIAGTGLGILPEFILRDALAIGRLERLLPDWSLPSGAVYLVMPPGGPRPKRIEALADFLVEKLAPHTKRGTKAVPRRIRPPGKAERSWIFDSLEHRVPPLDSSYDASCRPLKNGTEALERGGPPAKILRDWSCLRGLFFVWKRLSSYWNP